jgi:chromosomal replication initiation ATPase DnaA
VVARQLTLDLPQRPALGREDFLIGPCNSAAVAWIDRWPDWPGRGLALYGPRGAGKSHLAAVWQARSGAVALNCNALGEPEDPTGHTVLEDAETRLTDRGTAAALFHLFNRGAARNRHWLITGMAPPARWPIALPDLRSRLAALPAVEIKAPDDAVLAGLCAKLFRDRQLAVSGEVVRYLVQRIERSCAAVGRAVAALDQASLAQGRPITAAFARSVLNLD